MKNKSPKTKAFFFMGNTLNQNQNFFMISIMNRCKKHIGNVTSHFCIFACAQYVFSLLQWYWLVTAHYSPLSISKDKDNTFHVHASSSHSSWSFLKWGSANLIEWFCSVVDIWDRLSLGSPDYSGTYCAKQMGKFPASDSYNCSPIWPPSVLGY